MSWEFHPCEDLSQPPSLRDPHTGGWDGTEVSPGRGHGAVSPPQADFGTDGTAGHLIWPSFTRSNFVQVVLAHPPSALVTAGNVFRIGYDFFKGQAGRQYNNPLTTYPDS